MKVQKVLVSRVVSCYDGDTFRCDVDSWPRLFGHKIPVRIRGINCPEKKRVNGEVPPEALAAQKFTESALLNAKRIELQNVQRGKYFRLIADVWLDGQNLANALVTNGLAVRTGNQSNNVERCFL